jgi:hypothetical protein
MAEDAKEEPQQETSQIDNSLEKGDAVFPRERQTKISEWKRFIRRNIRHFDGDINSAAKLLFAFQKGSEYICEKFSPKFGNFKRPDIMILTNEKKSVSPFGCVQNDNKIFVEKSWLERFSKLEHDIIYEVRRHDGELVHMATPDKSFELAGVEETHHSLFYEIKGPIMGRVGPGDTDIASYDSQQDEYRALRWQIQYAVENNFPQKTIDVLRSRLVRAQAIKNPSKLQS